MKKNYIVLGAPQIHVGPGRYELLAHATGFLNVNDNAWLQVEAGKVYDLTLETDSRLDIDGDPVYTKKMGGDLNG